MSDSPTGGIHGSIGGAAERLAGGVHDAAAQVQRVACGVGCGIGEVREVIRAQPIVAVLVAVALGYWLGRSAIPSGRS
jgi:hypothetical protein